MVNFISSCEDNSGPAYPGSGNWKFGNNKKIYGDWIANPRDDGLQITLILDTKGLWMSSVFIKLDEFTGFEFGKEHDFKARREAGTIAFHGKVTHVKGSGNFEFTPDPDFTAYQLTFLMKLVYYCNYLFL